MKDKATKRPWEILPMPGQSGYWLDSEDYNIAVITKVDPNWRANAALIVKAVNLHDELVEALFRIEQVSNSVESLDAPEGTLLLIVDIAQEMLAKAKEIP